MRSRKNYKFTNRKHPLRGIMSTVLGVLSVGAYIFAVMISFENRGNVGAHFGITGLLILLYSCIGMYLGIASRFEKDRFYLFCYIGIFLNLLGLAAGILTLYLGVA